MAPPKEAAKPCIAWCYERCNKPDQSHMMKEMMTIARDLRSCFVSKKKAPTFVKWWLGTCTPRSMSRTVVFIDWREAKPLMESLHELLSESRQSVEEMLGNWIHVCVIAQSPKVYQRAVEWARTVMNNQVQVLSEFSISDIRRYAQSCLEEDPDLSKENSPNSGSLSELSFGDGPVSLAPEAGTPGLQRTLKTAQSLSLMDLIQAVEDPLQAAALEQLLKDSGAQRYPEDDLET
eukprot:g28520.t1